MKNNKFKTVGRVIIIGSLVLLLRNTYSDQIAIYYQGKVTGIHLFSSNAVPSGVAVGSTITGSLICDANLSTRTHYINGTLGYSQEHYYSGAYTQTASIEGYDWEVAGGRIELGRYFPDKIFTEKQYVDVFSVSDTSTPVLFPNMVGRYEVGFFVSDEVAPFGLYTSQDIKQTVIDLNAITTQTAGHLTTRRWDEKGDIVEGYYINFSVEEVSASPIPEPSTISMMMGAFIASLFFRRKKRNY